MESSSRECHTSSEQSWDQQNREPSVATAMQSTWPALMHRIRSTPTTQSNCCCGDELDQTRPKVQRRSTWHEAPAAQSIWVMWTCGSAMTGLGALQHGTTVHRCGTCGSALQWSVGIDKCRIDAWPLHRTNATVWRPADIAAMSQRSGSGSGGHSSAAQHRHHESMLGHCDSALRRSMRLFRVAGWFSSNDGSSLVPVPLCATTSVRETGGWRLRLLS